MAQRGIIGQRLYSLIPAKHQSVGALLVLLDLKVFRQFSIPP